MKHCILLIGVVLLLCISIELYNTLKMSDASPYLEPFDQLSPEDVNSDGFLLSDSYMENLPIELLSK